MSKDINFQEVIEKIKNGFAQLEAGSTSAADIIKRFEGQLVAEEAEKQATVDKLHCAETTIEELEGKIKGLQDEIERVQALQEEKFTELTFDRFQKPVRNLGVLSVIVMIVLVITCLVVTNLYTFYRIGKFDDKVDEVVNDLYQRYEESFGLIDKLELSISRIEKFQNSNNEIYKKVNQKIEGLNPKLDSTYVKIKKFGSKVDQFGKKVDGFGTRVNRFGTNIEQFSKKSDKTMAKMEDRVNHFRKILDKVMEKTKKFFGI